MILAEDTQPIYRETGAELSDLENKDSEHPVKFGFREEREML